MTILSELKKQLANLQSRKENVQLEITKKEKELARKIEKEKLGYQNVNTKALKTVCNLMSKNISIQNQTKKDKLKC